MFTQDSLDLLRRRIDLTEVLSSHLSLQRSGSAHKALCPFHDEKTPSFMVQKGDTHYHCFGCGAHGDAIAFLMTHLKMGFSEAVESLAERFHVTLERVQGGAEERGPSRARMKGTLECASELYHYLLLHSEEGQVALRYLNQRGLGVPFLQRFQIGFASAQGGLLLQYLKEKGFDEPLAEAAGLITWTQSGRQRDFFSDRITFPIRDAMGSVIGFSARKFKEETFGGKYINTPETPLFKKSRTLFGFSYSRMRMAKEKKAIVVEGQIDCLRLIHAGFDYAVAGQGTAFTEEHVREVMQLGVTQVFLALDGDSAGHEASSKIGHLFQKKGIEARMVSLPANLDPDTLLTQQGPAAFQKLLDSSQGYLPFLFAHLSRGEKPLSSARKNEVVNTLVERVRQWEMPVMVHESLKEIAKVASVPEELVGVGQVNLPNVWIKKRGTLSFQEVNPDKILEGDFLRWLIFAGGERPQLIQMARLNLPPTFLKVAAARELYQYLLSSQSVDLLGLGTALTREEDLLFLSEVMQRKVNLAKAEEGFKQTVQRLLEREWMQEREGIRLQLHEGHLSDEESLAALKRFDILKNEPPYLRLP